MSLLAVTSGSSGSSLVAPEGTEFDGVTDYLSRSTDLVGNVDSKTFTFSCWVYVDGSGNVRVFSSKNGTYRNSLVFNNGSLVFTGKNTVGTSVLNVTTPISINTFIHYIISCDLSSTAKRYVYINDINTTSTWAIYLNQSIKFTAESHVISADEIGVVASVKGRLSNLFLDYTYRDLSIEANRRLFITADGKPTPTATLKALNPILYLPMKDASTCHLNYGTGGNFVQNGTLDTASRGANQDNCVASTFDGVADYLSRTSLAGLNNSNLFVLNFDITQPIISANKYIVNFFNGTYSYFRVFFGSNMNFVAYDSTNQLIFVTELPNYSNINMRVSISINTSISKVLLFINGIDMTGMATTIFNNTNSINFSSTGAYAFGSVASSPSSFFNGSIGELYFDTNYIDLATNNPFWDAVENKPIPVRKVIADTGVTPLIAMPLDASNAGKNYGTGGDFTANSAPYVGARGASEFWARSAKFDGSTGYLSRGALTGAVNSKTFSFVFAQKFTTSRARILTTYNIGETQYLVQYSNTSTNLYLTVYSSTGTLILNYSTAYTFTAGSYYIFMCSVDMSDILKRSIYINGTLLPDAGFAVYANTVIDFSNTASSYVGALNSTTFTALNNEQALMYLTIDYIYFSQEANRLKFVDAMGYPTNLKEKIDAGVIPKPLIYLPFNDPSNLGLNLGTGGNFTVNGAVTAGADVLG